MCMELGTNIPHHVTYRDRDAAQFFLRRSDTKGSSAWNKHFVFFKAHVCAFASFGIRPWQSTCSHTRHAGLGGDSHWLGGDADATVTAADAGHHAAFIDGMRLRSSDGFPDSDVLLVQHLLVDHGPFTSAAFRAFA
jgi:hypothetical protein